MIALRFFKYYIFAACFLFNASSSVVVDLLLSAYPAYVIFYLFFILSFLTAMYLFRFCKNVAIFISSIMMCFLAILFFIYSFYGDITYGVEKTILGLFFPLISFVFLTRFSWKP